MRLILILLLAASLAASVIADDVENVETANADCVTNDGDEGACVEYHRCDVNQQSINEDGYSIIKAREGNACPKLLQVCCARDQIKTPSDAGSGNEESGSGSERGKCGVGNPSVNVFKKRDGDTGDRVYADIGEFPWMVAIFERNENEYQGRFIGEGSLIHPSVVLTVAEKLLQKNPEELKVRAGEWDLNSIDEEYKYQERNVAKIIIHSNYNPGETRNGFFRQATTRLHNNAALLILQESVSLVNAPHIGVGCLASQLPDPDTGCFTIGWGKRNFNYSENFASALKKVKLSLVSEDDCVKRVRVGCLGVPFHLHQSHVCAGVCLGEPFVLPQSHVCDGAKPEVNSCIGDGGSPLVCPLDAESTRFAIVGMASHQLTCALGDVSCMYVDVPSIHGWITGQMSAEGLDSSSFTHN